MAAVKSVTAGTARTAKPEYHHFIAQFLLRNFSHPYTGNTKKAQKLYRNTPVLNVLNIDQDQPSITEKPVRRIFGQSNMYNDDSALDPAQQRRVETELSKLENEVSSVLRKILKDCNEGEELVALKRSEEFLLKKFIFVMKYRSTLFFTRYNHDRREDYNDNDKKKMLDYMERYRFARPIDVWFDNLVKILTTRAKNEVDLHEGPNDGDGKPWTEFHTLCVVAPRVAILMRDDCLPELIDDQNEMVRQRHKEVLRDQLSQHHTPEEATSLFYDLPAYKPRSNYSKGENGRFTYNATSQGTSISPDLLYLPVIQIDSIAVQNINSLVLNEAYDLPMIAFKSKTALRLALEAFLLIPGGGAYSLKNYTSEVDVRVMHLKKLEQVAHSLGSTAKAVYKLPNAQYLSNMEIGTGEHPYDLHPNDAGLLHDDPLPRTFHTADVLGPFVPANELLFMSEYISEITYRGRTPSLEDLHAMNRRMTTVNSSSPSYPHNLDDFVAPKDRIGALMRQLQSWGPPVAQSPTSNDENGPISPAEFMRWAMRNRMTPVDMVMRAALRDTPETAHLFDSDSKRHI
ncbi:hypothetical protein EJ07DRAFT_152852 [Lizonia empirigonia]|nr:hypothetical protein EJ07DRAFT_152852 [Lizonia empirigonia]